VLTKNWAWHPSVIASERLEMSTKLQHKVETLLTLQRGVTGGARIAKTRYVVE
jgi:hypothetical protein